LHALSNPPASDAVTAPPASADAPHNKYLAATRPQQKSPIRRACASQYCERAEYSAISIAIRQHQTLLQQPGRHTEASSDVHAQSLTTASITCCCRKNEAAPHNTATASATQIGSALCAIS
jgi:hypothetical protein